MKLVRLEKSKPLDENKNVGKLLPKQIEVIQQNVEKVCNIQAQFCKVNCTCSD